MEIVPNRDQIWFMQDGCPAHNTLLVNNYLRQIFPNRLIANNGDVPWPARSPDLSPLDYFLWGHTKNKVYLFEPPINIQILEERVRNIFQTVNRNTLTRVTNAVQKRAEKCIEQGGRHIEQFL